MERISQVFHLYIESEQRHHRSMLTPDIFQFIVDLARTLLVEELSERVRKVRPRRLRGMADVHRHVRRSTLHRLLNRLSTKTKS